ncbi:GH25 family lysozyme [Clostridium psychrophilum]|uniref:GH25 family lysozyme n=1 Tax=Clostridium psychrophilum TaxID=132926 RepID=UPI001C0B4BA4|nr:GH25 family lysozyme [Clostridium psychrophilum]MBU3181975.1 LysM peptidoglycan-binding domain-containing protein [Clostridium psychrophilum]
MGIHLVKSGDTVCSIAKQYGVSSLSIIEANGLGHSDILVINQTLYVPLGKNDRMMSVNDIRRNIARNYNINFEKYNRVIPGAPTKLSVQRNTLISVVLFWEPAYDNVQVSGYYILRNNIPIGFTSKRVFVDAFIKIGETYDYKVTSYTLNKVFSGYSNIARVSITTSLGIVYWSKANQYSLFLKGIDVSSYTPELDWNKIKKDDVKYVYVRAGNSALNKAYTPDLMAQTHTLGIKSVGLPVGFYYIPHWSNLDYNLEKASGEAEKYADNILNIMSAVSTSGYGDLLPVLDIEPPLGESDIGLTGKQIVDWAKVFCDHFKLYTGRTIMIYTNRSFWNDWHVTPEINTLKNLPLWNAEFYEFSNYLKFSDDTPMNFGGWSGWNIWQFTQSAVIGGYSRMDQNWCPSLDLITPPAKPINLNGFNSSFGTVNLSWNKNTEIDLKGYNIYKDGVLISTNIKNYITITGLTVGRTYKFQVRAIDVFNDVSNLVLVNVYISR